MKPRILMNPDSFITRIGRNNLLEFVMTVCNVQSYLAVTGFHIPDIRQHPYLEKLHRIILILVVFAMGYSGAGTHYLYITVLYYRHSSHVVFVFQIAFERD